MLLSLDYIIFLLHAMPRRFRVALLIESSRAYGRGLLRGICQYAKAHGPWSMFHQERKIGDEAPPWLKRWRGDGLIARIENAKLLETVRKMGLPCVDLMGRHRSPQIPVIDTDEQAVVELAMNHFFERGFQHFAYCGYAGLGYSENRLRFLEASLTARGIELSVYEGPHKPHVRSGLSATEAAGLLYEDDVAAWLRSLPRPVAVVACNDIRGQQVLNACRDHDIAVPDEVAVLGVDNDEMLCELSDPPMSSVEPNTEKIGYEAARLLERMMGGQAPRTTLQTIQPLGVVTRLSTDVLAIRDRQIAAALRFIRDHATSSIGVSDVLRHVSVSRSTLERRFSELLQRSPKEEIIRQRLHRVRQLLLETDYTLARVAELSGFSHHEYMSTLFRQKVGCTPGQFRKQAGGGP